MAETGAPQPAKQSVHVNSWPAPAAIDQAGIQAGMAEGVCDEIGMENDVLSAGGNGLGKHLKNVMKATWQNEQAATGLCQQAGNLVIKT